MENILLVENIEKKFGSVLAVKDVSFSVREGEVFSLIGPNGSGKTTIVKLIAGLLKHDFGRIRISGYNVSEHPKEAKKRIGYIPDEPAIWEGMTGEEFLHFVSALFGVKRKDQHERISRYLEVFGLRGLEKGYFSDYSRGNKQKFSIIASLIHEPKLLLIDEPIVGLDPKSADIAKKEFVNFAEKGGAVLIVTHTLSVAQEISNRIGLLKTGKLVVQGTLDELRAKVPISESASLEDIYMALV